MKKRWIALVLALGMVAALFAGCGSAPAATNEPQASPKNGKDTVTLHLWMGIPPESGPAEVVKAFNEAYQDKGIQVEYERYVNDDQGNLKLETSLLAGSEIDVFVSYGNFRTKQRSESGMCMDLTPFMEKDGFDYPALTAQEATSCYVDGIPYSMYTTLGVGSLLVNADMFEKAGLEIPTQWTYEEFREACKQLTTGEGENKVYGMFWNTPQNAGEYMSFLAQAYLGGNWMYNEDGLSSRLNDPHILAATQLICDTMNVDGTAPTHADSVSQKLTQESMFLTGRCAMTIGNWAIRGVKDTEQYPHDFVTAYVPYPTEDNSPNYKYATFSDELSMNAKTEHPDEAWEFMKWYLTDGVKYMAAGGRIGLSNALDQDELISIFGKDCEELIDLESAKRCILLAEGDRPVVTTISTEAPRIMQILNEELEGAMNQQQTAQEALDRATQRADEVLAK